MKKSFVVILSFFVVISYVFQPKSNVKLPDNLDRYIAGLNFRILYHTRKYIDPSFRDAVYHNKISREPLDVVIPIVEKDLVTAVETVKSIRAMVFHPIKNIYLVAPDSERIRQFAKQNNCIYVLESDVIPNFDRAKTFGVWVFQQFIKLNCDKFAKSDNILVVDADTIFLRPQVFINDRKGNFIFNVHSDYDLRRKKFTQKLLNLPYHFRFDFVAHHMVLNKSLLQELKREIEAIHKQDWHEVILDYIVKESKVGFSEYDIYATFVRSKYPKKSKVLASANTMIYRDRFDFLTDFRSVYAADYKSISSHSFMTLEKND